MTDKEVEASLHELGERSRALDALDRSVCVRKSGYVGDYGRY